MMEFGKKLQQARKAQGLSQDDVAEALYVTRQTVSRWEQNRTLPNIYVMEALSALYEVSVQELFPNYKEESKINGEENGKKINFFALFGSIVFNFVILSGPVIGGIGLILSLWIVLLTFMVTPIILAFVNLTGLQAFDWFNTSVAVILPILSLMVMPYAKKLTRYVIDFGKQYCKFNLKIIRY